MKISNIEIKNFKSFRDVSVDLNNLNVLIGACSSGKTNFIEIFKFLKDISIDFNNAVNIHAGSFLQNFTSIDNDENVCVKISFGDDSYENTNFYLSNFKNSSNKEFDLQFRKIIYEISFNFNNNKCKILNENVEFHFDIKNNEDNSIFENELYIKNNNGKITSDLKHETILKVSDLIPESLLYFAENTFNKSNVPIINSSLSTVPVPWKMLFNEILFYDFDPKFCKNINKHNGNIKLTELGENLPFVLDNILTSDKRKFLNLVNILFPDIKEVDVDKITEDTKIFTIQESYSNYIVPAPLVSDGTSNSIALLIAIFFEESNNVLIEEPERNIHPSLLNKFVYLLKDASQHKQIIVTTHSPELLKNMDLNTVLFIFRDVNGFSNITKPINNKILKEFIDEFGIDEVFIDNYMEIGQ